MPVKETDTLVHEYPMPKRGVNLYRSIVELHAEEALMTKNMVYRDGLSKRVGSSLLETSQVVNNKKILGLHRGYYGDGTRDTLVACDTNLKLQNTGSGWTDSGLTQTTGLLTYFRDWGALGKTYIANGTDTPKTFDGTSWDTMSALNLPSNVQMLLPYQDRLLCISNNNNSGALNWSDSFDDTEFESVANIGIKPDTHLYGMTYHSATNTSAGYDTKILVAGATGMYLFFGANLTVAMVNYYGDYQIVPLPISIGCNAPNTMAWTPKGTLWLGIDRQVYLLPFNAISPIPVGTKITSNNSYQNGIESTPTAQIENACAVYHDGYYKLSVAGAGQSTNSLHFWLDVDELRQDENGLFGPWYGPMEGTYDNDNSLFPFSISCYATYNGTADSGQLISGESNAYGYVYQFSSGTYSDINPVDVSSSNISCWWWTLYHPLGELSYMKDVHHIEIELANQVSTTSVDFYDITGRIKTGDVLNVNAGTLWDSFNWSNNNWAGVDPVREIVHISPVVQTRRCAVLMKSASSDNYSLYALRVEAKEQRLIFNS